MPADPPLIHLACSGGGHAELLANLLPAIEDYPRRWITQDSARSRALRDDGERLSYLPEWDRGAYLRGRAFTNVRIAGRLLRDRPRIVITTGAGLVVPYCMGARALGAKLIFIETPARIAHPSKAGRVLGALADSVLVQWPRMQQVYRGSIVCTPPIIENLPAGELAPGEGTFAAVGTHQQGFDRLLRAVDEAAQRGVVPAPVVAQRGVSRHEVRDATLHDYLQPLEMEEAMRRAALVVCHGGAGIIAACLRVGRRPIVMGRKSSLAEHVDDHQIEMITELETRGLVVGVEGEITPEHVARAQSPFPPSSVHAAPLLRDVLRAEVDRLAGVGTPDYISAP